MADAPSISRSIARITACLPDGLSRNSIRSLLAATQGDAAAFGSIVDPYQQRMFRAARPSLGSVSDAEDALQEAFLRVYRCVHKFDGSRDLGPWRHNITANVCRGIARVGCRQGLPLDYQRLASDFTGPIESVAKQEQRRPARHTFARLPYKERAAITLPILEGLTAREVARVGGTPQATRRSQTSSGRAKLQHRILGDQRRKP